MTPMTTEELLALGFSRVGANTRVSRRAVFYDISGEIGDGARIDDFAIITGHIEIGDNTHVSPFCFLGGTGGKITLATGSGMSTHVSIFTKSDNYRQNTDGPRDKIEGDVYIGQHSILGAQCVVLPCAVIGQNCSFGVGCTLSGVFPDGGHYVSVSIKLVRTS